jgi:hypothetical protein
MADAKPETVSISLQLIGSIGGFFNNFPDSGRRGARLARRDDEGVAALLRGGVTPPDGMHRRPEMGSYSFADP